MCVLHEGGSSMLFLQEGGSAMLLLQEGALRRCAWVPFGLAAVERACRHLPIACPPAPSS